MEGGLELFLGSKDAMQSFQCEVRSIEAAVIEILAKCPTTYSIQTILRTLVYSAVYYEFSVLCTMYHV